MTHTDMAKQFGAAPLLQAIPKTHLSRGTFLLMTQVLALELKRKWEWPT